MLLKKEKIFIIYITYTKVSYWSYEKDFYLLICEDLKIITLPETSLTNLIKYNAIESTTKVK